MILELTTDVTILVFFINRTEDKYYKALTRLQVKNNKMIDFF